MKLSHLLFSLAMVGALVLAAIPAGSAYALTIPASDQTSITSADDEAASNKIVCRTVIRWRDGHRILVRICHRVPPPKSDGG